ncbi:MAG: chorismate-binding protein, partial [Negativicoccus succinicivorans]|nr:chorismate-binding protein [Negativicoccus succinicivorans]
MFPERDRSQARAHAPAHNHIAQNLSDAFQIVLSQRFEIDTDVRARDVYRMLKYSNPSPYMYLMNIPSDDFSAVEFTIVGSSPESLIAVDNNVVTTHPIAGSRPRGATRKADLQLE